MERQSLGQASVHGECATPLTVFFAISNQGSIFVEAIDDGLEYSVPDVVGLHLADFLAVFVLVESHLSGDLLHARILFHRHQHIWLHARSHGIDAAIREHHVPEELVILHQVHARRFLEVDGQLVASEDIVIDILADFVKLLLSRDASLNQLLAECYDAVFCLPSRNLFLCPVRRLIAWRMPAVTIRDHIQKGRAFLIQEVLFLATESIDYCQRIVTVHSFSSHRIIFESCAQTSREVPALGLAVSLTAHRILVIHYVEKHRQPALHVAFPQSVELIHRGEGHAFQHRAAAHCAIAQVSDHDAFLAVHLLIKSGTDCNGSRTAHDGVVRIYSERSEKCVHGAAKTFVEASDAGKNLCHRAIEQEADSQLLDIIP